MLVRSFRRAITRLGGDWASFGRVEDVVNIEKTASLKPIALGWREWVGLPDLGIPHLKAKVDTGARTSALHAFWIEPFTDGGVAMLRFKVHPFQGRADVVVTCTAAMLDRRWVSDSGGHRQKRYVIQTTLAIPGHSWPIEMTLTERDSMKFRMLLGRTALGERFVVHPGASYLLGKRARRRMRD